MSAIEADGDSAVDARCAIPAQPLAASASATRTIVLVAIPQSPFCGQSPAYGETKQPGCRRDSRSGTAQPDEGGAAAPTVLGRIRIARDQRMGGQEGLHTGALDADAAAVDQPDLAEASRVGGDQVLVDDGADVLRPEGVQVERVLDRQ